jgi:hypothetical protein
MELSDDRITTLVEDVKLPHESFVTTFGDKIFQTNLVNNSVTCYTINGGKLWVFRDESVLRQPTGVAIDNNYNIYVTSYYFSTDYIWSKECLYYTLNSSLFRKYDTRKQVHCS